MVCDAGKVSSTRVDVAGGAAWTAAQTVGDTAGNAGSRCSAGLGGQPLSPLDGRYLKDVQGLTQFLSEAGLGRARVRVEVEWIIFLCDHRVFEGASLPETAKASLREWAAGFSDGEIARLAELEAVTQHDVKACEYLVREKLTQLGLTRLAELTHICCTSEDINSVAYALTVKEAVCGQWLPAARRVQGELQSIAREHSSLAMLAHTHGQPATPTTLGREIAVFAYRLGRQLDYVERCQFFAKFSGATGTFAAHLVADPAADWQALSREFVTGLGLDWNALTTQIESHDWQAELYSRVSHAGRILHNLATDMWTYISMGYFKQIPVAGTTGSSTMPHKVNPIRFENAEANLEIADALLEVLQRTLVTSRLQRDLTDSTTQRNIGVAFGHSLLALTNISRGLAQVTPDEDVLRRDLQGNWEVLGEAIQTVVRAEIVAGRSKIANPYALLKDLTRGKRVGADDMAVFIRALDIGEDARERLLALKPELYTGLAAQQAFIE